MELGANDNAGSVSSSVMTDASSTMITSKLLRCLDRLKKKFCKNSNSHSIRLGKMNAFRTQTYCFNSRKVWIGASIMDVDCNTSLYSGALLFGSKRMKFDDLIVEPGTRIQRAEIESVFFRIHSHN